MKKVSLVVISILILGLGIFYIILNRAYKDINKKFNDKIDDYNNIVYEYKEEYNVAIEKINTLSDIEVTKRENVLLVSNKLNDEKEELEISKNDLNDKKESLNEQKKVLTEQYNKLVEEERKKHTYMIKNVKTINQYAIGYPTGCESAALTILLNYYGENVSVKDVVEVLKKGDLPHTENGVRYGGNPYLEFIGHPANPNAYGVYDEPIVDVANHFKPGIINGKGMSLNEILELVRQDKPVVVWNTMNLAVPYINQSWIYKPTGETIKWLTSLHALVVIGYNDSQVIVSDSLNGKVRYFDRKTFESRYNAFGKRALYY